MNLLNSSLGWHLATRSTARLAICPVDAQTEAVRTEGDKIKSCSAYSLFVSPCLCLHLSSSVSPCLSGFPCISVSLSVPLSLFSPLNTFIQVFQVAGVYLHFSPSFASSDTLKARASLPNVSFVSRKSTYLAPCVF